MKLWINTNRTNSTTLTTSKHHLSNHTTPVDLRITTQSRIQLSAQLEQAWDTGVRYCTRTFITKSRWSQWKNKRKIYPLFCTCNHLLWSRPHSSTWPHYNHPNDLTPPKSNHHSIYATNHPASVPPFRINRNPPQPSFHPNHQTKWEISKTTTCASQTIPLNIIHPYTKLYLSPQITSPINHQLTIQTTQFVISAMTTFASKTKTQCTTTTTSLPTTITTQSTFKFDGEHEKIPHHIQYVHGRKAIKAYLSEHSHRRVCSKNKEKKHQIQFMKDNTNKNLIGNPKNQNTPQPLFPRWFSRKGILTRSSRNKPSNYILRATSLDRILRKYTVRQFVSCGMQ